MSHEIYSDVMPIPRASERVVAAAAALGLEIEIHQFLNTKTAQDAADAVGCALSAIAKSLVFLVDGRPVIGLVPGDRRLDTAALAGVAGGLSAKRAPLDVVRDATGFAAGGTPPFGHPTRIPVYADEHLRRHETVWAAGGTPDTVFPLTVDDLIRVTDAEWAAISVPQ